MDISLLTTTIAHWAEVSIVLAIVIPGSFKGVISNIEPHKHKYSNHSFLYVSSNICQHQSSSVIMVPTPSASLDPFDDHGCQAHYLILGIVHVLAHYVSFKIADWVPKGGFLMLTFCHTEKLFTIPLFSGLFPHSSVCRSQLLAGKKPDHAKAMPCPTRIHHHCYYHVDRLSINRRWQH